MAEYNKHVWTAGEPITPEKVNNMENGIEGAYNLANSALNQNETLGSSVSNLENSIQNVNDKIGTGFDASHTIAATVANNYNDLNNRISIINQANASGNLAWGQLLSVGVEYNNATDTVTKTLQDILDTYATVIALNSVNTTLTASLQNAYTTPSPNDTIEVGGNPQTVASLAQRIQHIYNTITAVDNKFGDTFTDQLTVSTKFNELNTLLQNLSDSLGNITGVTLGERISALDGGSINSRADLPTRSIKELITEIGDAHSSTAFASEGSNATYDNLDERFEAGENRIVDIEAEIAGAHHTTATTLDARFDAIDGGGQPSRTLPNVISEIETARDGQDSLHARISAIDNTQNDSSVISRVSALENNKVNTADVYNDLDRTASGKVLDARQGKALNDKIIGVKDEVETARTSSIIKEDDDGVMVDKTYTSLDARLEAIEAHAANIRSDIDIIAGELDMVDTNGLKTIGTRVDALDAHITTVADELGMVQSGEIVNTNTRIDTIDADLNTADTGIKDRLTAVESKADAAAVASTVNTALNGLDARVGAAETAIINLQNEPKSATEIVSTLPETGDTTKDYLLGPDEDGHYFYYKWINGTWNLISGGGSGTGNSSAEILSNLPAANAADPNTDYYIGDNINGYIHYRYIPSENENEDGVFISILPKNLINSVGVGNITVTTADALGNTPATTAVMSGGLQAYAFGDTGHSTNLLTNFTALRHVRLKRTFEEDGITLKKQELIFTDTSGNELSPIEIVGGSGSAAAYTIRLLGGSTFSIPSSQRDVVNITPRPIVNFGSALAEGVEISASVQYKLSTSNVWQNADINIPAITNNIAFTLNVASLLGEVGTTTEIKVTISTQPDGDEGDIYTQSTTYRISRVEMSINSVNYNPAAIRTGASFQFNYTCLGVDLEKIVTFKIDNNTVVEKNIGTSHNESLAENISLTTLSTGMHTLQVYFTANGIQSNVINTYLICNKNSEREAPLVGLAFANSEINYGDDLTFNYTVYTPGAETTDRVDIEIYTMNNNVKTLVGEAIELLDVNNSIVNTQTIIQYPENTGNDPYTLYVTLTATKNGDTPLTDNQTISIQIKPFTSQYIMTYAGTNNLVYKYEAYGHTNNEANKETYTYTYTAHDSQNTPITFTGRFNNFNWATDGYKDGALTISGGATHTIDVPIFSSTAQGVSIETDTDSYSDPTQNGRTIELDFTIRSATDLTDVIMSCMGANHAGFKITPQNCYLLNTNKNVSLDATGAILNESAIAAAYLTTGVRTHLVFVIEPWAAEKAHDQKYHQSVNIYINGEFANACPYDRDNSSGNIVDSFTTDATITMGSASCIIDLYSVKLYNRGLTHTEVLQNYKMAPASMASRTERFAANDVIKNGKVDYELARKKFNCLLLVGPNATNDQGQYVPTISPYKGAPSPINRMKDGEVVGKVESGLILTRPNNDENHPDGYQTEFSLLDIMTDGGYASSNNVQGTSSQKYPIHNLKIYLMAGTEGQEELDPDTQEPTGRYKKSSKVKYKIPGSKGKGESTLCWKADYMSTDHANTFNANIADSLFSESLNPEISNDDWRTNVQNTVNGMRCLLFQQQGDSAPEFVADGCLNNDKGNSKTYGLEYPAPTNPALIDPEAEYDNASDATDTVAQKWEFTNNSDDLGFFKYDCLFYPTGNDNHYRALDAFESCYPDQGDLDDAELVPNYNHLQVLSTWVSQRANYWDETDPTTRAAKKAIFKNEFEDHFNLDHVLVYYLFSEYVALCDNRVKNMFMRSDTIRKEVVKLVGQVEPLFEGNSNPNADFWKEFIDIDTGEVDAETGDPIIEHRVKNANQIDWENSTFAIWAPVLYDLDSCFGVENVGYLKIPYNADWQYYQDGQYLFNGHDSVFWLMFEDSFDAEIRAKALTLYNRDRGLNYNTFYQEEIVGNNNAIAPAMTNQDMILKFDIPWATGFINYANKPPTEETPEYKYLQRGSRAAQKTSFIFKRSMLLSSKYQTNAFKNDRISMRYGADVPAANAVVKLAGNQIFYPAVSFGDNKGWTQALELDNGTPVVDGRVNAGEICRIRATSAAGGQDTLFIGGASVLTDVGDLSVFKAYEINVAPAVNLKKIAFGSHEQGYINEVTSSIGGLSSCVLLEEINIENCTNFQSLDLSANGLIKRVYATGSGAALISVPTGGVLEVLELGARTNNITILNQSHLTTFSYENSQINEYANLNKLWIENTPNVPVVDIINKAIGHLTGGIRLIGINVNLGNDATFLEKITSDLAKGKYMTNRGVVPTGNNDVPTITGTVTISSIRQSLYNKLAELYPNLTINVTTVVPEYTITYKNYNGQTLYVDHRTASERYIDPVKDINSVTGTYYISIPTRPEDQQYYYYFGRYSSSVTRDATTYTRYSGWLKVSNNDETSALTNEYVTGNTTVIADYKTTELRTYTVEWYEEELPGHVNEILIKRLPNVEYGTRVGDYIWPDEDGSFERAQLVNNSYYKVFTGWSRPVGVLTENVKIYGQWKTSNITNATTSVDFSTLSGADLYALAHIGSNARSTILQSHLNLDTITVPLGCDFNYSDVVNGYELINADTALTGSENEAIIFNGTNGHREFRPFQKVLNSETNTYEYQNFTLAIDYKALLTSTLNPQTEEYVIASCYEENTSSNTKTGFKIVVKNTEGNTKPVVVTWGSGTTEDTYTIIDYININTDASTSAQQYCHSYRNIVVLSFSKEDPTKLNVYFATPSSNPSIYSTGMSAASLTWSAPNTNAPLILGGNYEAGTTNIEASRSRVPSAGVAYWIKYWDADLGGTNCNRLAAWPHEQLHFYLTGYASGSNEQFNRLLINDTGLTFVTAEVLGDRRYDAQTNTTWTGEYASWSTVSHRNFYNNRIYAAFSDEYKSIILSTLITSNSDQVQNIGGNQQHITTVSNNYLFPPAYREVAGDGATQSINSEANGSWPWLSTSTLANCCYVYAISSTRPGLLERQATVSDVNPFRYRFSNYYLTANTKIFNTGSTSPYHNGTQWTVTNGTTVRLVSGDIWNTGTAVYVYVSPEDIEAGIKIDLPETEGGWKASETWQTRTFSEQYDQQIWYYFHQVDSVGAIVEGGTVSRIAYGQYKGLVFEFAV